MFKQFSFRAALVLVVLTFCASTGTVASPAAAADTSADLALRLDTRPDSPVVGVTFQQTLVLNNYGPSNATGVIVAFPIPSSIEVLSAQPSQGECIGRLQCFLDTVPSNGLVIINLKLRALQAGTFGEVASATANEPDLFDGQATATFQLTVINDEPTGAQKVVVFLEGVATDLTAQEIADQNVEGSCSNPDNDHVYGVMKKTLATDYNFKCTDFLRYSYKDGSVERPSRNWSPNTYDCLDPANQEVSTSVKYLHQMLVQYRKKQLNKNGRDVRFVLVGHSLGGYIALEATKFLGSDGLPANSIRAVVTIDSPLNHASAANRESFDKVLGSVAGVYCSVQALTKSTVAFDLGNLNGRQAQAERLRDKATAKVTYAKSQGARVLTIGNPQDCVWNPAVCNVPRKENLIGAQFGGEWIDDSGTMIAGAAATKLYPRDNEDCDLSVPVPDPRCLSNSHNVLLKDLEAIADIGYFSRYGFLPPSS